MTESDEEFLTVADIAGVLKLNQQTIRNWIDAGTLPALHVGRRVRVRRSDFNALIQDSSTGPPRSAPKPSQAQEFWEGTYHPTPVTPPHSAERR